MNSDILDDLGEWVNYDKFVVNNEEVVSLPGFKGCYFKQEVGDNSIWFLSLHFLSGEMSPIIYWKEAPSEKQLSEAIICACSGIQAAFWQRLVKK